MSAAYRPKYSKSLVYDLVGVRCAMRAEDFSVLEEKGAACFRPVLRLAVSVIAVC